MEEEAHREKQENIRSLGSVQEATQDSWLLSSEWKDVMMADLASLEVWLDQDELDKELMVRETEDLKVWVSKMERRLVESQQEVDLLLGEWEDTRIRLDQMRVSMVDQEMRLMDVDNLLAECGDVFAHLQGVVQGMVPLVQELAHFRVALQHGADNLIVVMDDEEEDMDEAELEERYGPHRLVPIEELNGLDSEEDDESKEEDKGLVAGLAGLDLPPAYAP